MYMRRRFRFRPLLVESWPLILIVSAWSIGVVILLVVAWWFGRKLGEEEEKVLTTGKI